MVKKMVINILAWNSMKWRCDTINREMYIPVSPFSIEFNLFNLSHLSFTVSDIFYCSGLFLLHDTG